MFTIYAVFGFPPQMNFHVVDVMSCHYAVVTSAGTSFYSDFENLPMSVISFMSECAKQGHFHIFPESYCWAV